MTGKGVEVMLGDPEDWEDAGKGLFAEARVQSVKMRGWCWEVYGWSVM